MPDLSVVIPSYNTASMTLGCCKAVLAARPEAASMEVIVADDGSGDGTGELLAREAPEVRVVRLDRNSGFARAANAGIAAAESSIVLLLNSDAMVDTDALKALLAAFANDPRLGVASAQLLNRDGTPQWSGGRTPTLPWIIAVVGAGPMARMLRRRRDAAQRREVDWVSGAAMAFRTEVWRTAGPLVEEYLFYCQDIDFCLRARGAGWNIRIIEEARVTHGLGRTIAAEGSLPQAPDRLWPDLVTWGARYYGRGWALRARVMLVPLAAARVVWRLLLRPGRIDATTRAMVRAVRRLC